MNGVAIILHASLAVILAALACHALGRMPAATRAAVWTAAIVRILLLPGFRWVLPQGALGGVLDLTSLLTASEASATGRSGPPPPNAEPGFLAQSWPLILLVGWGTGAFFLLMRLSIGLRWTDVLDSPVTFGILRPVVLRPTDSRLRPTWSPACGARGQRGRGGWADSRSWRTPCSVGPTLGAVPLRSWRPNGCPRCAAARGPAW